MDRSPAAANAALWSVKRVRTCEERVFFFWRGRKLPLAVFFASKNFDQCCCSSSHEASAVDDLNGFFF
eukprot:3425844-Karenia_brevis.AAC.1